MTYLEAFLGRSYDGLTFADLQHLVDTRAAEDTQLEFKRQLYDDGEERFDEDPHVIQIAFLHSPPDTRPVPDHD